MVGLQSHVWIPLAVVLATGACRRTASPNPPCLDHLEIAPDEDPQDPLSVLDRPERQALETQFRKSTESLLPPCRTPSQSKLKAVAKFQVARRLVLEERRQDVRLKGALIISLKGDRSGFSHFEENVATMGAVPLESGQKDSFGRVAQDATQALMVDLVNGYRERLSRWLWSNDQLHAVLKNEGIEARLEAIQIVATRGMRAEIPLLLEFLTSDDERLRDAALGALLKLRVREAVPILTKSREMKDAREMQKIIDAIATLGGEEATSYLSFVAETHDSEHIRDLAKKALQRVSRAREVSTTK